MRYVSVLVLSPAAYNYLLLLPTLKGGYLHVKTTRKRACRLL
jgi:hypothetical protein